MIRKTTLILLSLAMFSVGCGRDSGTYYTFEENRDITDGAQNVPGQEERPEDRDEVTDPGPEAQDDIVIYICGEVNSPGVYELSAGSRIVDAIAAAGGITENGDGEFINQAELLSDGERIRIPDREEAESIKESGISPDGYTGGSGIDGAGFININSASEEELTELNGIGQAKAEAVIKYREENGPFSEPEDIMKVSGIGESTYNAIKDKITIGQENR